MITGFPSNMPYWVWPTLALLAIPAVLWWFTASVKRGERKRTAAMARMAQEMRFEFAPQGSSAVLQRLHGLPLLHSGSHIRAPNLMMKNSDSGRATLVYDFHYRTGTGPRRTVLGTTVVHFVSPRLDLPQFALSPENAATRGLQGAVQRDIDFEHRPRFSKAFWLRGEDEQAIRRLFGGEPIRVIEGLGQRGDKPSVEGRGNDLVIHRQFRRARPAELPSLIKEADEILAAFEHAQRC